MNYFPHSFAQRPALPAVKSLMPVRQTLTRDVLWGQPVFKAPALPNPRIVFDPLPFTAARPVRITRRG